MSNSWLVSSALITTGLIAVSAPWAQERNIPLADVPPAAIAAAEAAVEGLRITGAETEVEDGRTLYELEGVADGVEYEVEVTADGEVLEIETD